MFQFTHPQGVRFGHECTSCIGKVSIHAPARGAITADRFSAYSYRFNSRTRKGCDKDNAYVDFVMMFQFTHPQGVRFVSVGVGVGLLVSIHVPARGAIY